MNFKTFIQSKYPYLVCIAFLLLFKPLQMHKGLNEDRSYRDDAVKCIICLDGHSSEKITYCTGFNYEMLRRTADMLRFRADISLGHDNGSLLDSLEAGSADILVLPMADSALATRSNLQLCSAMADSSVWVVSQNGRLAARKLDLCLSSIRDSEAYKDIVERFAPSYEPFSRAATGRFYKYASPYDNLLKEYSKKLEWDYRMLAALVWQESGFRIESRSKRGAEGLLQLMEQTAISFNGSPERLDPEVNLQAGVKYLAKLQRMFMADAANQTELVRFTLAAFNAGEGRIKDCIQMAESHGLPHSTWEDIKAVIPLMRDNALVDSLEIRHGVFIGTETIAHVDRTDSLYRAFSQIIP